jgi:HEAT repeat protein
MAILTPFTGKTEKEKNIAELVKHLEHKNAGERYSAFVALARKDDLGNDINNKLKKMVNDPDPWVKTIASLYFAKKGDLSSISANLMEIMNKGSQSEKIELLQIIAGRGSTSDETVMQVIVAAMFDKKETIKIQGINAAAATKSEHLIPYLGQFLHEKHQKVRLHAAYALHCIGGEESVDYLIGFLIDKNREVQAAARSYLEAVKFEHAKKALHDADFMLLARAMNETEPVREKTAQKIGHERIREGLPLLHLACKDNFKRVRLEALRSIALFKNPTSVDVVEKLLDDKYYDVRIEAIHTLEKIGGKRALRAIKKALDDKHKEVRDTAQETILKMK